MAEGPYNPLDATLASKIRHYLNGVWYFTTLTQIKALFDAAVTAAYRGKFTMQYGIPTNNGSITVTDTGDNIHLDLDPAAAVDVYGIQFPVNSRIDKQELIITTTENLTTVAMDGGSASIQGTATSISANTFVHYKYDATLTKWTRIG